MERTIYDETGKYFMERKLLKSHAKGVLKKHYWIYVLLCLMAGVIGISYTDSLDILKLPSQVFSGNQDNNRDELADSGTETVGLSLDSVYESLLNATSEQAESDVSNRLEAAEQSEDKDYGFVQIGRRRGVLSLVVNKVSSGALYLTLYAAVRSMVGSDGFASIIFIMLGTAVFSATWLLVTGYFKVIMRRIYLEGRTYDELPFSRMMFLVRIHKVVKVVLTLTLQTIYMFFWKLTIVGGIIKYYSYYMVPYILAENPGISSRKAITLSRNMMNGHKWECFKLELSFFGWQVLSSVTFGLSGLFFSNPYQEAVFSEYYAVLRTMAIENNIPDAELLKDKYLFKKASAKRIAREYKDIPNLEALSAEGTKSRGKIADFLCSTFGIILRNDEIEEEYRRKVVLEVKYHEYQSVLAGKSYPGRLYPIPEYEKKKKNVENMLYLRHYSITSLILLFFSFSFIGWIWEVSLHLISDGTFVNRGVLHGPWLPIYGTGGIMILVVLTKLRKKPWQEFAGAIVLAGLVEYFTAWYLEATHNGQKWWDYSGYFLNLHGRICAEGLLVFGLGGLAIVYFAAPLLDNLFKKLSLRIRIPICAILLVIYAGDQIYSGQHPNTGKGITDYEASVEMGESI